MDLAEAYAAAAEAPGAGPKKRADFWREARRFATESLQMAQTIVAKKPETAAEYATFISKDKELQTRAASSL